MNQHSGLTYTKPIQCTDHDITVQEHHSVVIVSGRQINDQPLKDQQNEDDSTFNDSILLHLAIIKT